jgi:Reverse transcriptase (RNA-dependent DNA polymerase)
LTDGLQQIGFTQSINDPCVFWRRNVLIVIYTDDTIVTGPDESEIDQAIKDIGNKFNITTKDNVDNFLGVKIVKDEGTDKLTLTQPQLIDSILADLNLDEKSNARSIPALSSKILQAYADHPPHSEEWHYRSVIGKLNYLEKATRPDIAYAVHQCARFAESPKEDHTQAVKLIGRYLLSTRDKGLEYNPTNKSFEVYSDADFSGNWEATIAEFDGNTARSRSGYAIFYAGCPVSWSSKLQTEIALSSTESEYISLSQSLREVIPLMRLINELKLSGFDIPGETPRVLCKAFEDNSGALEMARTPKMRPRTKHLNIKYHHFREAVLNGDITIWQVNTLDQIADLFTKPLGVQLFVKFRELLMGW